MNLPVQCSWCEGCGKEDGETCFLCAGRGFDFHRQGCPCTADGLYCTCDRVIVLTAEADRSKWN